METVTEILIDFSTSMITKMALTKSTLLNLVIPKLDFSTRIGVRTFTTGKEKELLITQVQPLSLTNKEQLKTTVNSLGTPGGDTPLASAIRESVNTLAEFTANDKILVILTDGEENQGGNPELEIQNAKDKGIDLQIHFIVIGESEKTKMLADAVTKITNCSFSSIPFTKDVTTYNEAKIKPHLSNFFNSVKQRPIPVVQPTVNIPPTQQTKSEPDKIQQPEVKEDIKIEQSPDKSTATTLGQIVEDIKEIKEQLKELRREKTEVPEAEEDPVVNEQIRKKSEEYLNTLLKKKYPERVNWLNENGESYADHDFEIIDQSDSTIEYYIECKGTTQNKRTFFITKKEWWLFLNHTKNYQIYFVRNSFANPTHIFIDNLLDWILKGKVVPFLLERAIVKEERVYLTINETTFTKDV